MEAPSELDQNKQLPCFLFLKYNVKSIKTFLYSSFFLSYIIYLKRLIYLLNVGQARTLLTLAEKEDLFCSVHFHVVICHCTPLYPMIWVKTSSRSFKPET
jgi:hypothetical protein